MTSFLLAEETLCFPALLHDLPLFFLLHFESLAISESDADRSDLVDDFELGFDSFAMLSRLCFDDTEILELLLFDKLFFTSCVFSSNSPPKP